MYRFTHTATIDSATHSDLCFTDRASAIGYAAGCSRADSVTSGYLHVANVTDWDRVASWEEAVSAWANAGMSTDEDTEPCCYADSPERREALSAAGFGGMVYDDVGPENAYRHETIRVWDSSVWSLVRTEKIEM